MLEYFSSRTINEILISAILIYFLSIPIGYLAASIFLGVDPDRLKAMKYENNFKLIITPYEKKVIRLTIMLSPIVFLIIYFFVIKLNLY
jgi:hypothetical protein